MTRGILITLGLLLLTAAAFKGYQLLTEPVTNGDIWSYRPYLVLVVECELALGLWLLSGLFPRAAWAAALVCFSFFSFVTLYKAVTGASSCGCFGSVHVDPWITLTLIDLPAVLALGLFRPASLRLRRLLLCLRFRRRPLQTLIRQFLRPSPSASRFTATVTVIAGLLGLTTPILALNEPAAVTATYEVLDPETWIGRALPILEHIDIAEQIQEGTWLVLFYHHDCPDCRRALPQYAQMARDLAGNEDSLRIALIEVPPYGPEPAWPATLPDRAVILAKIARTHEKAGRIEVLESTSVPIQALQ